MPSMLSNMQHRATTLVNRDRTLVLLFLPSLASSNLDSLMRHMLQLYLCLPSRFDLVGVFPSVCLLRNLHRLGVEGSVTGDVSLFIVALDQSAIFCNITNSIHLIYSRERCRASVL